MQAWGVRWTGHGKVPTLAPNSQFRDSITIKCLSWTLHWDHLMTTFAPWLCPSRCYSFWQHSDYSCSSEYLASMDLQYVLIGMQSGVLECYRLPPLNNLTVKYKLTSRPRVRHISRKNTFYAIKRFLVSLAAHVLQLQQHKIWCDWRQWFAVNICYGHRVPWWTM